VTTATSFLVAATTSLVVHTTVLVVVVVVVALLLVILVHLAHLLVELLIDMGSNDPFFFGFNFSDNILDVLFRLARTLVASLVQLLVQAVDLLSGVVAEFLPVEHLGLLTADSFVFELLLGDPEFNAQRLVAEDEALIEVLDSELGRLNIVVKNETLFEGSNLNVRVNSEFNGHDSSALSEKINHLLLSNVGGDVLNE